jgi:hypothetical protein
MNTKQLKSMVVVLVAVLAGCAAPADDQDSANEPASELAIAKGTTTTSTGKGSKDAGSVDTGSSSDSGSVDTGSTANDTGTAANDTGSVDTVCPVDVPVAGTACSVSTICGYGGPCGLAMAQCSGGVWVISGSSSC